MTKLLKRMLVASLVCGLAILPAVTNARHVKAATAQNGRISFITTGTYSQIKSIRPDLASLSAKNITSDTSNIHGGPYYSPDGTKLIYQIVYAPTDTFIANADGTNAQLVENQNFYYSAKWNPSGLGLLITRSSGGNTNIYATDLTGANAVQLTTGIDAFNPVYSQDGTKIAYTSGGNIFTMNADGSNKTNITGGTVNLTSTAAQWSPDGTKILYPKTVSGTLTLGLMNADGSNKTTLPSVALETTTNGSPIWSPDGTKIAYVDAANNLRIMNSDGTNDSIYTAGVKGALNWQRLVHSPSLLKNTTVLTLNNNTAAVSVPDLYTDAYGEGMNKTSVSIISNPTSGIAVVDNTTGVVTYTKKSASRNIFYTLSDALFPRASAAASLDAFNYKVCSNANSALCATGTISIALGTPNTGIATDSNNSYLTLLTVSVALLITAVLYRRVLAYKKSR